MFWEFQGVGSFSFSVSCQVYQ